MEFLIALVIFCASIAVYKDAIRREIANPVRWGVGTAFIFIVVTPIYLFKRKKLTGSARTTKSDDVLGQAGKRDITPVGAYFLMFVIAFITPVWFFLKGDLPACDSKDVESVITKLLNGEKYSEPAQISYDRMAEVRHCNLTMNERVFSYTVSWYSDAKDQFIVQFSN